MCGVPFPSARSKTNEAATHVESPLPGRLDGGSIPPGSTPRSAHAGPDVRPRPCVGGRTIIILLPVLATRLVAPPGIHQPQVIAWMGCRSAAASSPRRTALERAEPPRSGAAPLIGALVRGLICRPSPLRSPRRSPRHRPWRCLVRLRWPGPAGQRYTSPGWRPGTRCSARW